MAIRSRRCIAVLERELVALDDAFRDGELQLHVRVEASAVQYRSEYPCDSPATSPRLQ